MNVIVVALMGALMGQPGGDWRQVSVSTSGTKWFVRADDIANDTESSPTVWVHLDFSQDNSVRNRTAKRRFAIDCAAATYQMLANIEYDARGTVVTSSNDVASRYRHEAIAPDTVTEDLAKAVCPAGKYGG